MGQILNYIKLLRPTNWLKNLFIFLPVFFNGDIFDIHLLLRSTFAFISFCFIASAIYIINDYKDIEKDRCHPVKCKRPLASGKIKPAIVFPFIVFLVCSSIGVLFTFHIEERYKLISIILLYFFLNLAYTFILKNYAIIDVFIISFGFVLRIFLGGSATGIILSPWIILLTFLITLLMAFAKRRDDVIINEKGGTVTRKNTLSYNLDFMNLVLGILSSISIVCYILYTVSPDVVSRHNGEYIYLTTIFVLAGILRYLQVTIVNKDSGSPTKILLHDRFIQFSILAWIVSFLLIIYIK